MKSIRANPVKMDSIMREVEALKAARHAKKEAKHARKEAKREAKHGRHEARAAGDAHAAAAHAAPRHEGGRAASPRRTHHDGRSPARDHEHRRRDGHDERRRSRSRERRRSGDGHRSRSREHRRSRERRRSRSRERRRSRSRERAPAAQAGATPAAAREVAPQPVPRGSAVADGACAQAGVTSYGLTFASADAEAAARAKADAQAVRPAYAPAKAPVLEAPATWERGRNSARHRAGQLTEEERAARLAAMTSNAEEHEDARWQRLRRESARDAADASLEAHAPAHHHTEKPAFLGHQERELFGSGAADGGGGGMTMAERVGARKHFQQRGADTADAFRR